MENLDDAVDWNSADEQTIHFFRAPCLRGNSIHFLLLIDTGYRDALGSCEQAAIMKEFLVIRLLKINSNSSWKLTNSGKFVFCWASVFAGAITRLRSCLFTVSRAHTRARLVFVRQHRRTASVSCRLRGVDLS